ncbi:hypothetical protein GCM10029992_56310 [Glycomyces albus]
MSSPGPDPQPPPPPPYQPPPYGYQYPPPRRPTNGMAIAAMVLGIVGACNPVGLLGLIFGTIARRQIAERGEEGDGFAVTGIILGWVAVAGTVFWILYIIFWVWFFGNAVTEFSDPDNWPSEDPTFLFG